MNNSNKTTLVYDLPTRLFHWSFAALFVGAFFIAKVFDDESAVYPYHMMLGMTMAFVVVLRILWGFFGSKYAKFSSFELSPSNLISYMKNIFSGDKRWLGHNPASSWAAIVMMLLALGSATTGFLMSQGRDSKEMFEDVHELFANAFVLVVIAHIAGIVLHTLKHKEMIGLSMLHGRKNKVENAEGVNQSHPVVALVFLFLLVGFMFQLNRNYDVNTKTLNFFGKTIQLGEAEGDKEKNKDENSLGGDEDKEHDGDRDGDED